MQSITATVTIAFLVGLITRRAEDFMRSDDQLKLPDFQCMDHDLKTLRNDSVEIHVKAEKIEVKVNQLENNVSMVATTCALESQRLQDHGRCIDMYNRCKEDVNKYRDESRRKFNDTLDEVQKLRLEVQQSFKENTQQGQGRVLILMVVLGAGEFVLGVVLINGLRKLNALKTQTRPEDIKHGMKPDPNTLKGGTNLFNLKQKDSARLQKLVTIVSFNDGRQKAHKVMLEDITRNLQTEFLRISRKEEALQIKSQVTVLFVERNDRHIILESEQEIGDLKVSCVRSILKLGGKVIVVYCGHRESEDLGNLLCSPSLKSADWHKELRSLKDQNCFLSINKSFSQKQKEHLKTKLMEYLKE